MQLAVADEYITLSIHDKNDTTCVGTTALVSAIPIQACAKVVESVYTYARCEGGVRFLVLLLVCFLNICGVLQYYIFGQRNS